MTSESPESPSTDPVPGASRSDRGLKAAGLIAGVATVFAMFFLMGFVSAWLKSEGNVMALVMRGLKFGVSGSIGVICIGATAKSWQRLAVPPCVPPMAAFAVGFFVMNGLGEAFDGRYESMLPKAGGGFLTGCLAGLGLYWAPMKGWVPLRTFGSPDRSASEKSGE